MNSEFERVRELLWGSDRQRLDGLQSSVERLTKTVSHLPSALAEGLEHDNASGGNARLAKALAPSTAESLERALRERPQAIVEALFPIIGPTIRRALQEALRGMAHELDRALQDAFTLKALRWRLQAWRSGVPYSQIALRHRFSYRVDHLFLISADSGLLLDHVSADTETEIDVDAVAGMLSAIEQFVQDSMAAQGAGGGLNSASVGSYRLLISPGPTSLLAAFVRGVPPEQLKTRLDELVETLHSQHLQRDASSSEAPRGTLLSNSVLDDLNRLLPDTFVRKRSGWALPAVALLSLALIAILGVTRYLGWRDARQVSAELAQIPGVVVLDVEPAGFRKLSVRALYDAAVEEPRLRIGRAHPTLDVRWQLHSQVSTAPAAVAIRVRKALELPSSIQVMADAAGQVTLSGALPFAKWHAVSYADKALPGGVRLNTDALTYPHRSEIGLRVGRIEAHRIEFDDGSQRPTVRGRAEASALEADLRELVQFAATQGIAVVALVYGYTDEPGSVRLNRELRLRRAEWVADSITSNVPEVAEVDVGTQTISAAAFHGRERAARVKVSLIPMQQDSGG